MRLEFIKCDQCDYISKDMKNSADSETPSESMKLCIECSVKDIFCEICELPIERNMFTEHFLHIHDDLVKEIDTE